MSRRAFIETGTAALAAMSAGLAVTPGRACPESSRKIRMGVVGGGFGSTFHWHEHPNCVVTGVTDLRADRRKRLQESYKCDKAYDSLESMLKQARDIDAVAIFSGAPDHARHVRWCFERGWHVVSATPVCITLEDAAMLKALKEKTGLKYMMAESSYYRQECILARELYKQGKLGEIFYSEVEYYHDRGDLGKLVSDKTTRFYEPDGSRSWRWGLPPMLYPTHSLGYLVGVSRERVVRVSCLGWGSNHPYLKDNAYKNPFWNQAAIMQTDKGHICRCNVFWLCAADGETASWYGDKASFHMPRHELNPITFKERISGKVPIEVPQYWNTDMLPPAMRHSSGHGGSAVFISAEFVNALLEDREPAVDIYESLAMTVPGIVAHKSALKSGEQLAVPSMERPA